MADIYEAYDIIERMTDGFEEQVLRCIASHTQVAEDAVREQMYSGLGGDDKHLAPTYDNDPYFEEPGPWQHMAAAYKRWKLEITPPIGGAMLLLPPRPDNVPNLYINGKFHSEVFAEMRSDVLYIDTDPSGSGPDIVSKYGERLLRLGPTAIGYINETYIKPHIWQFFEDCGFAS